LIILAAFVKENVPGDVITNVWAEIYYRYDICRVTHGALIEHL
jgi:hypothetical protein